MLTVIRTQTDKLRQLQTMQLESEKHYFDIKANVTTHKAELDGLVIERDMRTNLDEQYQINSLMIMIEDCERREESSREHIELAIHRWSSRIDILQRQVDLVWKNAKETEFNSQIAAWIGDVESKNTQLISIYKEIAELESRLLEERNAGGMHKEAIERTRTMQRTVQREVVDKVRKSKDIPAVYNDKHTEYSE